MFSHAYRCNTGLSNAIRSCLNHAIQTCIVTGSTQLLFSRQNIKTNIYFKSYAGFTIKDTMGCASNISCNQSDCHEISCTGTWHDFFYINSIHILYVHIYVYCWLQIFVPGPWMENWSVVVVFFGLKNAEKHNCKIAIKQEKTLFLVCMINSRGLDNFVILG